MTQHDTHGIDTLRLMGTADEDDLQQTTSPVRRLARVFRRAEN